MNNENLENNNHILRQQSNQTPLSMVKKSKPLITQKYPKQLGVGREDTNQLIPPTPIMKRWGTSS